MYSIIVLPTDGSPGADAAAAHAIDLAVRDGATLHVLNIVDTAALPLDEHAANLLGLLEEAGYEAIEVTADRARRAGVEDVVEALERGAAHRHIVRYARENDADLVVMGTHGRTGLDRVLLGSVSERVVRTAGIPVLVVPTPEPGSEADETDAA